MQAQSASENDDAAPQRVLSWCLLAAALARRLAPALRAVLTSPTTPELVGGWMSSPTLPSPLYHSPISPCRWRTWTDPGTPPTAGSSTMCSHSSRVAATSASVELSLRLPSSSSCQSASENDYFPGTGEACKILRRYSAARLQRFRGVPLGGGTSAPAIAIAIRYALPCTSTFRRQGGALSRTTRGASLTAHNIAAIKALQPPTNMGEVRLWWDCGRSPAGG